MNTPICDFVEKYVAGEATRLHMPGHKGQGALEKRDITEIGGADVLYHADGIIKESQDNAARLFGAGKTLYSCEGSSLAIRGMLYLARLWATRQDRAPLILAGRNAHKTFVSAAALLDLQVEWLTGEDLLSGRLSVERVREAIGRRLPAALYVTSPDYLGNRADIAALSEICRAHGVLLLVDNAHGAYLHFLPQSAHPMAQGADMCCDSAHKTLPVLTGGAYLHIAEQAPSLLAEQADNAMALFASTSPSYLILQSLDRANAYLAAGYRDKLSEFLPKAAALRRELKERGFDTVGDEPLKLTLAPKSYGYTGAELAAYLLQRNIVVEFADPDYVVLMLSAEQTAALVAVAGALTALPRRAPLRESAPPMALPRRALTIREAVMRPSEALPLSECEGRVLGALSVSCPPAVPVVVSGEVIGREQIALMRYYGIEQCFVAE